MEETSLFKTDTANQPLAARIRPKTIDDIIGQGHLLGAAGCRENDVGSCDCRTYEGVFCGFFGCYGRH